MAYGFVKTAVGQVVQSYGQRLVFFARDDIGFVVVDGTDECASIVLTCHLFAQDIDHGGLGSIGHHLDGVDEVLALCGQAGDTLVRG